MPDEVIINTVAFFVGLSGYAAGRFVQIMITQELLRREYRKERKRA